MEHCIMYAELKICYRYGSRQTQTLATQIEAVGHKFFELEMDTDLIFGSAHPILLFIIVRVLCELYSFITLAGTRTIYAEEKFSRHLHG